MAEPISYEEGCKEIRKHAEAILSIAKEIGISGYVSVIVIAGRLRIFTTDAKDGRFWL